jgi:hypothetical protein
VTRTAYTGNLTYAGPFGHTTPAQASLTIDETARGGRPTVTGTIEGTFWGSIRIEGTLLEDRLELTGDVTPGNPRFSLTKRTGNVWRGWYRFGGLDRTADLVLEPVKR